jgi:hypothetical protein
MLVRELTVLLGLDSTALLLKASVAQRAFAGLATGFAVLTAAAAAAAGALFLVARSVANQGHEIGLMSRDVGLTTKAYQELAYSAKLGGIDQDRFNAGLRMFVRHLGDVNRQTGGFKAIQETFANLHIKIEGRDPADILNDLSRAFQNIPGAADRASLAMQLFSRFGGARFGSWLAQGPDALARDAAQLHAMGAYFSPEDIAKAARFRQAMIALTAVFHSIGNTIAFAVMPNITAMLREFDDWYIANGDLIRSGLASTIQTLADAIAILGGALGFVLEKVTGLVKLVGGWERAMRLLGSAVLVLLGFNLGTAIGAITSALYAAATAAGAFGAGAAVLTGLGWAAGFAGLVLILEDLWGYFSGKKSVTGLVVALGERLMEKFEHVFAEMLGAWEHFWSRVGKSLGHASPETPSTWPAKTPSWGISPPALAPITRTAPGSTLGRAAVSSGPVKHVSLNQTAPRTINVPAGSPAVQGEAIRRQIRASTPDLTRHIRTALAGA